MCIWALSPPQWPGAPHLARFSRDVGYRRPRHQTFLGPHNSKGVPQVRQSVPGPKTMGEAHQSLSFKDHTHCHLKQQTTCR